MSYERNPQIGNLTFDEWMQLAKNNPEEFELKRQKMIESEIEKSPSERQLRLRQLQFRCDGLRRKYKHNAQVSAEKMYRQMQESFNELRQALIELHRVHDELEKKSLAKPTLTIVKN
jgi:predicted RNase H-like nuclease (RuvC/YqgF family)